MSYSKVNISTALPILIQKINNRTEPYFVSKLSVHDTEYGNTKIYIKLNNTEYGNYTFEINDDGEVYNAIMTPSMMACVFDWLKHIDQKRTADRIKLFKQELFETCMHPSKSLYTSSV